MFKIGSRVFIKTDFSIQRSNTLVLARLGCLQPATSAQLLRCNCISLTCKFGSYSDLLNSHTSTNNSVGWNSCYLWKLEFLPFVKPEVWTLPIARIFQDEDAATTWLGDATEFRILGDEVPMAGQPTTPHNVAPIRNRGLIRPYWGKPMVAGGFPVKYPSPNISGT